MWTILANGIEGPIGGLGGGAVAIGLGYVAQWLIRRRTEKREDTDADVLTLRNIANDSLEREKVAYARLTEAETRIAVLDKEAREMRDHVAALEVNLTEAKRRADNAERDNDRFRGYIDTLERSLRSQGIQPPPQMD